MSEYKNLFSFIKTKEESLIFSNKNNISKEIIDDLSDMPYDLEKSLLSYLSKEDFQALYTTDISFYTIISSDYNHIITADPYLNKIYVMDFFYQSLYKEAFIEFKLYLYVVQTFLNKKNNNILIDLKKTEKDFFKSRSHLTNEETKILLSTHPINSIALTLIFLARNTLISLSYFEKKILKELMSNIKIRKILNMEKNAYDYLKNKKINTLDGQEKSYQFQQYINNQKQDVSQYISETLSQKKIFLWFWWSISPFLAKDVASFIDILHQELHIKRIYIDLPSESQFFFNQYIKSNKDVPDSVLESHIKTIYPPFLDDYQKETILYLNIVKKFKYHSLPFFCVGQRGSQLLQTIPYINRDSKIEFPMERQWASHINNEINNFKTILNNEIILFIQFLKPMMKMPYYIQENNFIETMIHVDQFTGYAPNEPSNTLSTYSYYNSKPQSFLLPHINTSFIKNEEIVHLPIQEDEIYVIDHSKFNQFHLYNSLYYSHYSNGGGNNEINFSHPNFNYQTH